MLTRTVFASALQDQRFASQALYIIGRAATPGQVHTLLAAQEEALHREAAEAPGASRLEDEFQGDPIGTCADKESRGRQHPHALVEHVDQYLHAACLSGTPASS